MSYANLIMYNAVIPSFHPEGKEGEKSEKGKRIINADENPEEANKILLLAE
jgi:hypothetical protein